MAALRPLLDSPAAEEMDLKAKIPSTVAEKLDDATKIKMVKNLGNALLNHGYYNAAHNHFEEQMEEYAYDIDIYVGAALAACLSPVWGSEEP